MQFNDAIQILDLVDSGVIMLDSKQRIVFWNQFVTDTSLISFENIEGKFWLDVFPSMLDTRVNKAVDKAVNFNFPSILSYKLLKQQFPFYKKSLATRPPYLIIQSIIVKPLMVDNENQGCIIYINDVSAASKREEELNRQSIELQKNYERYTEVRTQFEQVFDNTHNSIIVFNLGGEIVNANIAACDLFQYCSDNLIGGDIGEILPRLKELYYNPEHKQYQYSEETYQEFDQTVLTPSETHLAVSVSQIGDDADNREFFVFITDVTERKLAQTSLMNANAELEEFAYRTSHDLRSPIVSSLGLLQIAEKSLNSNNSAKALECLDHAENSLRKLEVLIQDILKLTEMKNAEEAAHDVCIQECLDRALEDLCQLESFDKITKHVDLQNVGKISLKPSRFIMIIENLLSNAIKYYDPQEKQPRIDIKATIEDGLFKLRISDNGLGIPEDQKHKLFTMFNRFHPKVAFGSGLGLYLIKKSAAVLGGDIEYIDQNKGACFQLVIPQSK